MHISLVLLRVMLVFNPTQAHQPLTIALKSAGRSPVQAQGKTHGPRIKSLLASNFRNALRLRGTYWANKTGTDISKLTLVDANLWTYHHSESEPMGDDKSSCYLSPGYAKIVHNPRDNLVRTDLNTVSTW